MFNSSPFSTPFASPISKPIQPAKPVSKVPDEVKGLVRCVNYLADYSGCGLWRLLWPEHILNAHQKTLSQSSSVMILNPDFYQNVKAIRIQRQATPHQREFVKFLKNVVQPKYGSRLIYEIDDIIFREDIPDYNKFKFAFESDEIRETSLEIMNLCDEITVTCDFMRDYYREKTGRREITVIPNFPPKFWIGNFFNEKRVYTLYQKHKKRPRILYAGSGAHFDVDNKVKQRDDFEHVTDAIIATRKEFQWVFIGAFPLKLRQYMGNDMEFHPWQKIYNYPQKIHDLEIQMCVAPLQDNNFNKAKSDLKYIEASCFGLPIACQDLPTYSNAPIKFKTGEEMINKIRTTLKDSQKYKNNISKNYRAAEKRFLERDENLECFMELYTSEYGSSKRVHLNAHNNDI